MCTIFQSLELPGEMYPLKLALVGVGIIEYIFYILIENLDFKTLHLSWTGTNINNKKGILNKVF